jgi:undecaprenyl-diphosphatase
MDKTIFLAINSLAGQNQVLDWVMIFLANAQGYLMVGLLALMAVRDYRKYTDLFLSSVGAAIISRFVLAALIKFLYESPGPYWEIPSAIVLVSKEFENSFPSGHASFFFALSAAVYSYNKKLGILFFCQSLLMGLARIYVGAHWPSDILAGILLGWFIGWLGSRLYKKYAKINPPLN